MQGSLLDFNNVFFASLLSIYKLFKNIPPSFRLQKKGGGAKDSSPFSDSLEEAEGSETEWVAVNRRFARIFDNAFWK